MMQPKAKGSRRLHLGLNCTGYGHVRVLPISLWYCYANYKSFKCDVVSPPHEALEPRHRLPDVKMCIIAWQQPQISHVHLVLLHVAMVKSPFTLFDWSTSSFTRVYCTKTDVSAFASAVVSDYKQ